MPAISDLHCIRQGSCRGQGVSTAAVASENGDLRLRRQPTLRSSRLSVRKKRDRPTSLQIADDRAVATIAPPRPIIDPHHRRRRELWRASSPHDAKQRIIAHRQQQPLREARRRSAAESQAEMEDKLIKAGRPARPRSQNVGLEPLGEDPPPAKHGIAVETPREDRQSHGPTRYRQIGKAPSVTAVNAPGLSAAARASSDATRVTDRDAHPSVVTRGAIDREARRNQR